MAINGGGGAVYYNIPVTVPILYILEVQYIYKRHQLKTTAAAAKERERESVLRERQRHVE